MDEKNNDESPVKPGDSSVASDDSSKPKKIKTNEVVTPTYEVCAAKINYLFLLNTYSSICGRLFVKICYIQFIGIIYVYFLIR